MVRVLMDSTCLTLLTIITFIGSFVPTLSNPDGFLNINCGASSNKRDSNGLEWISDYPFIQSRDVSSASVYSPLRLLQYMSLAYFTNLEATRYCYLFPVKRDQRYLVRATFLYGDSPLPLAKIFDLLLGENKWTKVDITNLKDDYYRSYDIILDVKSASLSLCLARNAETQNESNVFISTIELRQLQSPMYNSIDFGVKALDKISRLNFGGSMSIRYPKDPFDRIWSPFTPPSVTNINAEGSVQTSFWNQVPGQVLETAIMKGMVEMRIPLVTSTMLRRGSYYFALYFCHVNNSSWGNSIFDVSVNQKPVARSFKLTSDQSCADLCRIVSLDPADTLNIVLSPVNGSDMGPFINAAEAYKILDMLHTDPQDVLAIGKISDALNVPDDWRGGDPCLPVGYSFTGVNCSQEAQDKPFRVTIINLSNMGLTGDIPSAIADLTALTELLLGHNSLSGSIPDLSSLKNLKTLQLQNNQLTGKIPESLVQLPDLNQLYVYNLISRLCNKLT